jgi:hypothetical protein
MTGGRTNMRATITGLLVFLIFSLTLNAYLFVSGGQSPPAGDEVVASNALPDFAPNATDAYRPTDYFDHLRGLGLTVDETKPLILSRVESEVLSDVRQPYAEKYWEPGMNEDYLDAQLELIEQHDVIRAALTEIYGPEAQRDPAFRRVFRPLDPRLATLTSAQQVAYQRYQLERQRKQTAELKNGVGVAGQRGATAPDPRVVDYRSTVEELGQFLDPAASAEVLYRYSPLAERIRSAGVELSETEFRETFRLLEKLELGPQDAQTYLATRDSLRRSLGADRFTRLWTVRDPVYAAFAAAGTRLGLTEATTLAAYQIVNDTQELMAEAVRLQAVDPERAKTRMRETTAAQREKLSGLVGPEAAESLLRSLRVSVREMTGQSVGGGRPPAGLPTRAGQSTPIAREVTRQRN